MIIFVKFACCFNNTFFILNKQTIILFFVFFTISKTFLSQIAVGFSFIPFALHIDEKTNRFLYINYLFEKKTFNYELGLNLSLQHYFGKTTQFSIWGLQGCFRDAAERLAGYTGIEGKTKLFRIKKTMAELGAGVTLSYRQTWEILPGYIHEKGYHTINNIEYKSSITMSYTHFIYLSNNSDFLFSALYNFEKETVFLSAGIRLWIGLKTPCGCGKPYKKKHFI